ncbi:MAG TPA: hypothetical protein HA262_13245 [Methanosarcina sp.]|jgi:hypothetical protein|nr:hypothetical protein [Methanosarcina sp.]
MEEYEVLDKFINPVIGIFEEMRKEDTDYLLYGAPLAMYFHVSPYADWQIPLSQLPMPCLQPKPWTLEAA